MAGFAARHFSPYIGQGQIIPAREMTGAGRAWYPFQGRAVRLVPGQGTTHEEDLWETKAGQARQTLCRGGVCGVRERI